MAAQEQDLRLGILNSLLTTPHRELWKIHQLHADMVQQDPLFYARLAAWFVETGEVRDHKEMFVVMLCLSDFDGHRDEGLAMLREMPPYQVCRVVDFIVGGKKSKKLMPVKSIKVVAGSTTTVQTEIVEHGLFRNVPRSLHTEVLRYLREREADSSWFDSSVMTARKSLKRLYALSHIKPSERAQAILFDRKPPDESSLAQLKELSKLTEPADQARIIVERRIPYRVASTVISHMTPSVILALVEVMSPQELINNLGSLKRRGAFDNLDIKSRIDEKLKDAKGAKRVAAMKTSVAAAAADVDAETKAALDEIADTQLKAKGHITRPTALLVDKSGSMKVALEVGKRLGVIISAVMDADLYAFAFDVMPYRLVAKTNNVAGWTTAFKGLSASGGTSYGCTILAMLTAGMRVENFVVVGDGGENNMPFFVTAYRQYAAHFKVEPSVVFVKVPGADTDVFSLRCQQAGINVDVWEFKDNAYYSLPTVITLLTKPSKLDLLVEIMNWPVPKRRSA